MKSKNLFSFRPLFLNSVTNFASNCRLPSCCSHLSLSRKSTNLIWPVVFCVKSERNFVLVILCFFYLLLYFEALCGQQTFHETCRYAGIQSSILDNSWASISLLNPSSTSLIHFQPRISCTDGRNPLIANEPTSN